MDPIVYTLKHPVEIKNKEGAVLETISELRLNRIKGRQARSMKAESKMGMMVELVGASAGLPPSTVDLIDFEDIVGAAEAAADFFGPSLPTGGKS